MSKSGADAKVKKTLIRNYEQKLRPQKGNVIHDVESCSSVNEKSSRSQKENELDQPTLCSSEALANYLTDVKNSLPPPLSVEHQNIDKSKLSTKMTKKLNFHFNNRIYKNLIELNASVENIKTKKDKRPTSSNSSVKRDLEPNIEDFYEDEVTADSPPKIPTFKPKFKPVKIVENGQLHKIVASFEDL